MIENPTPPQPKSYSDRPELSAVLLVCAMIGLLLGGCAALDIMLLPYGR